MFGTFTVVHFFHWDHATETGIGGEFSDGGLKKILFEHSGVFQVELDVLQNKQDKKPCHFCTQKYLTIFL